MIATKKNPRGRTYVPPRRGTSLATAVQETGRSPAGSDRPAPLAERILAEFHRCGIPASRTGPAHVPRPGGRVPVPAQPITAASRAGTEAIVVVIDEPLVEYLFGESGTGRVSLRLLLRATRVRSCENQLCETTTAAATAADARRLLIVCDAGRTSVSERTRAIRWVREMAHRIGYECSINGLHNLGTSYLVLVAATEAGDAARSVVDWYRGGEAR